MKIACCGSAPSSVSLAPYEDASWAEYREGTPDPQNVGIKFEGKFIDERWEIWGCSPALATVARRVTRWFELHRWEPGEVWFHPNYLAYLREFKGPVYVGGPIPKNFIPNQVLYPIKEIVDTFTSYFLTSSLALMCALAIYEIEMERARNPDHDHSEDVIGFFGVDMAAAEEYGYQRAGCQHFILEALRRGIGVYVPPESCLLLPMPIYAISEWDHKYIKLRERSKEINARKRDLQNQLESARDGLAHIMGAAADLDYYVNTFTASYALPAGEVIRMSYGPPADHRSPPEDARDGEGEGNKRGRRKRKESGNGPLAAQSGVSD